MENTNKNEKDLELQFDIEKGAMIFAEMNFIRMVTTMVGDIMNDIVRMVTEREEMDYSQILEELSKISGICVAESSKIYQQYEEEILKKYQKGN